MTLDSQSIPLMTSLAALYHYQQRNLLKQGATKKQKTNRTRISEEGLEILGCRTIMPVAASLRRLPTPRPFTPTLRTGSLRPRTEETKCVRNSFCRLFGAQYSLVRLGYLRKLSCIQCTLGELKTFS